MALNLKGKAKKAAAGNMNDSKILEGREKIKLEELVASYGKDLNIVAVDVIQVNDKDDDGNKTKKDAAVMVVAEAPRNWVFGGGTLLSIISSWLIPEDPDEPAPTMDQINEELKAAPISVRLEKRSQVNDPRKTYWHYEITD